MCCFFLHGVWERTAIHHRRGSLEVQNYGALSCEQALDEAPFALQTSLSGQTIGGMETASGQGRQRAERLAK